jgi:hypothetical protein
MTWSDPSFRSDRPPRSQVRPLTQSERTRIFAWVRHVEELVRDHKLVRGDECLARAIVKYPSLAVCGWTWPGEQRLAQILNESDRNIRKREKRLRDAGVLVVVSPSEGWRSNRYVPILRNRPLFETALGSEKVRAAVSAQCWGEYGTRTAESETAAESGTSVPPTKESAFPSVRNERSAESLRDNPRERISPTPDPTPTAAPGAPRREGESLDLDLQEANSTGEPGSAPTPDSSTTTSTKKPGPHEERDVQAEPDNTGQTGAPVVEFSFAGLMRDYPHPPGGHGIEHEAYRGHARNAWNTLTPAQKHNAEQAAPNAPGKEWLGHWLNSGRETGKFEIVDQRVVVPRVWVRQDTPQWAAWVKHNGANGRRPPTTQHRADGELQTGWWFASEWPQGLENAERVGGVR